MATSPRGYTPIPAAPTPSPTPTATSCRSPFPSVSPHFHAAKVTRRVSGGAPGVAASADSGTEKKSGVSVEHLIAGGIAGAVSRTLTAPLDRLKILYEVQATHGASRNMWKDLKAIGERGGIRAYFRGNGANVLKIVPKMGLKFYGFEHFKVLFKTKGSGDEVTLVQRLMAGASAAAVSQFTIQPLDCVKIRIAASDDTVYSGITDTIRKMWRHEGFRSFYKGVVPSVVGIAPAMAVDLATYDTLKELYRDFWETDTIPGHTLLAIGMVATAFAYAVGQPFGVIRARLMVQGFNTGYKSQYSGAWDVVFKTVKKDGITGMYRGLVPQLLRVLPAGASSYLVYEWTLKFLRDM